jgi:hypothetical protein
MGLLLFASVTLASNTVTLHLLKMVKLSPHAQCVRVNYLKCINGLNERRVAIHWPRHVCAEPCGWRFLIRLLLIGVIACARERAI